MSILSPSLSRSRAETTELASIDYPLLVLTCILLVVGAVMVYSASFVTAHTVYGDDTYFLSRQLAWIAVGAVAMFVGTKVPYHAWRKLSLPLMVLCVIGLVAVLVPGIGASSYGASRWLRFGSAMQLQPSELAKFALALYLADWLARRGKLVRDLYNGLLPFVVIVGILAALIEIQPDLGTTVILVAMAGCMFFVAGANLAHIGAAMALGAFGAVAAITRLSGYRQNRISAFLDPWSDLQGSGWHTAQQLIALGTGGLFGVGLGGSHQKFGWIPNAHTDSIFAIIGEELGFVGCLFVLLLFALLAWRGFTIAWQAPDAFGRLFATGLTCLLTVQALVNIAVVTNTLPDTGITLPFISFGGNSMVVSMLAVGLLLSISRHRDAPREELAEDADEAEPRPHAATRPGAHWGLASRRALGLAQSLPAAARLQVDLMNHRPGQARPAARRRAAPRRSNPGSRYRRDGM